MAGKKGGSGMSNAERVARWRQRQRESPRKHEEYKRKERERYKQKKRTEVVKPITDMTNREQRLKRKQWRQSSNVYYSRKKNILKAIENTETPPNSPEHVNQPQVVPVARQLGRKKVRRDRSKAYREIFKLRVALKNEERLKEKYKKRLQRQKKAQPTSKKQEEENIIKGHDVRKAVLLYSVIIKRLKQRYRRTKKHEEKRNISSLVCATGLVRRYKLGDYAKNMLCITNHQMKKTPSKRKINIKATRVKQSVHTFLERDDNSRLKADKRATTTRNGQKKQIRILNDDLKHLHEKFNSELEQRNISYSLFCKLRPFWIRAATARDRETCLCKLHENLSFKLETAHAVKLYSGKNINDIVKTVTCNNGLDSKECMYRTCQKCKKNTVPKNDGLHMGKQVKWKMWKNRRIETHVRVVREIESGTLETLDTEVNNEVNRAARHIYNIRHQYQALAFLKENMNENEILIHMDFSENYSCKLESEIQSMHFGASQRQVSVHTGIVYSKNKLYPFATVSDCLIHNPAGIWGHLQPIFESLKPVEHGQTVIHFLSDGPTTQYRNRTNMYLFSTKIFDLGFRCGTWNYLEAGHGKGAADGIGAVVKRTGDRYVLAGHDIKCAADLKEALTVSNTSIHMFEVKESDIMAIEIPPVATIRAVPQTMRLHQVTTNEPGILMTREVSCFCNRIDTSGCNCFEPVMTEFDMKKIQDTGSVDAEGDTMAQDTASVDAGCDKLARDITDKNSADTEKTKKRDTASVDAEGDTMAQDNASVDAGCNKLARAISDENSADTQKLSLELLKKITVDGDLIGQYIVVEYDGLPYPGEVLDQDEDDLEVKVMHKVGRNRFFWPDMADILWYHKDKVVTILEGAPERVTGRHCKINQDVWHQIEEKLDL